ncbi:hypothetical protein [Brevibacillus humidisoli]|uniref:hypothetical protein n=1 Tax=Brevibacillus humidisoli TaxID=2895522 RepID=UPI003B9747FF
MVTISKHIDHLLNIFLKARSQQLRLRCLVNQAAVEKLLAHGRFSMSFSKKPHADFFLFDH